MKARQFIILSGLTALEAIRRPICLLLTVSCIVATSATPLLLVHRFGEEGRLARDGGLAFHLVFGLFIAVNAASFSLAREIKSGTAAAVLSKPVSRTLFLAAKYAGILVVVAAFSSCSALATLLSERIAEKFSVTGGYVTDILTAKMLLAAPPVACLAAALVNYRTKRPFQSTAFVLLPLLLALTLVTAALFDRTGHFDPFHFRVCWQILPASMLVTMALAVIAAIATALSTRLEPLPVLTICGAVFLFGLMSNYLADSGLLPAAIHGLIPNWQHFWVCDALSSGGTVPLNYVLGAGFYAVTYCAGILCLGIVSFRHADL